MIINHNLAAMNTYRQYNINNNATSKSLEKLSSGLRINNAADDAAGLAISEKMRGQIRGLDQASANAQDGISMIQTAEGALSETESILQRMRELATQAANDTNTESDRAEIQKEINQLTSEINRIGNTTEFNTQKLLKRNTTAATGAVGDVTAGTPYSAGSDAVAASSTAENAASVSGDLSGITGAEIEITVGAATYTVDNAAIEALGDLAGKDTDDLLTVLGNATDGSTGKLSDVADITVNSEGKLVITAKTAAAGTDVSVTVTDATAADSSTSVEGVFGFGTTADVAGADEGAATAATYSFNVTANFAAGDTVAVGGRTYTFGSGDGEIAIGADAAATATNLATAINGDASNTFSATDNGTGTVTLEQRVAADSTAPAIALTGAGGPDFTVKLQIGANTGQSFTVNIADMRADALDVGSATAAATKTVTVDGKTYTAQYTEIANVTNGTDDSNVEYALDVSSHDNATAAIKVIDEAINLVSAERSNLGAYQNRLEHTINNLGTASENLTSAESRIRDVDMAKEMMNYQKTSVLQQAAQAMLAQANQQPQNVLQLLK